jgi:heptose I phosphotransferase
MAEWRRLEAARARGLPVPRPIAVGEFIGPWGQLQSFIVLEAFDVADREAA